MELYDARQSLPSCSPYGRILMRGCERFSSSSPRHQDPDGFAPPPEELEFAIELDCHSPAELTRIAIRGGLLNA